MMDAHRALADRPGPNVVVALHGLTMTGVSFHALADQLVHDIVVLAPDLRGRGHNQPGPPYGFAMHADDVAEMLDAAKVGSATLVGYSTGALVAVLAAHRRPDLVDGLVLVDAAVPPAPGPDTEQATRERTAAVLERVRTTFPSTDAYVERWRRHPALASSWNPYLDELFTSELTGAAPDLRSSIREEAILTDSNSYVLTDDVLDALVHVTCPTVLLRASRGMLDEDPGICTDEQVERWRAFIPHIVDVPMPDFNHYTMLLTEAGARQVADVVRLLHRSARGGGEIKVG